MNIALWLVSGLLAALFLASGAMKLARPKERLGDLMNSLPAGAVKGLGMLEVAAAAGLLLPAALDIAPVLVPVAATGVVLMMAGAAAIHARRREPQAIVVTSVLLVLALVVAWGRFGPQSFTS